MSPVGVLRVRLAVIPTLCGEHNYEAARVALGGGSSPLARSTRCRSACPPAASVHPGRGKHALAVESRGESDVGSSCAGKHPDHTPLIRRVLSLPGTGGRAAAGAAPEAHDGRLRRIGAGHEAAGGRRGGGLQPRPQGPAKLLAAVRHRGADQPSAGRSAPPGNVAGSTGAGEFIDETLARLRGALPGTRVEAHAASAFFSEHLLDLFERWRVDHFVSVPFARFAALKQRIESQARSGLYRVAALAGLNARPEPPPERPPPRPRMADATLASALLRERSQRICDNDTGTPANRSASLRPHPRLTTQREAR